jgi:hypothetical protein
MTVPEFSLKFMMASPLQRSCLLLVVDSIGMPGWESQYDRTHWLLRHICGLLFGEEHGVLLWQG